MSVPKNQQIIQPKTVIEIVRLRYKVFLLAGILSCIGAFLFSSKWFIPTKYKCETVVYVPLTKISEQLIFTGYRFATDKETDEFIQILHSNEIVDSLNSTFDLVKHYQIDSSIPELSLVLRKQVQSNTSISKTRYGSIAISVMDEDPDMAANMANEIVRLGDVLKENLYKSNNYYAFKIADEFYTEKANEIERIKNVLYKEEISDQELAVTKLETSLSGVNLKLKQLNRKVDALRKETNSFSPDQQMEGLTRIQYDLIRNIAADSSRVAEYSKYLNVSDTLLIKAKGTLEANKGALVRIKSQISNSLNSSIVFEDLQKEIAIQQEIKKHLERDLALLKSAFNPQFPNVNSDKTKRELQLELEQLIERKAYYEKTKQHLNNIVPKVYVINKAISSKDSKYPNRLFIVIVSVISIQMLTLLLYLIPYFLQTKNEA